VSEGSGSIGVSDNGKVGRVCDSVDERAGAEVDVGVETVVVSDNIVGAEFKELGVVDDVGVVTAGFSDVATLWAEIAACSWR
jgi:hypothetical protein